MRDEPLRVVMRLFRAFGRWPVLLAQAELWCGTLVSSALSAFSLEGGLLG